MADATNTNVENKILDLNIFDNNATALKDVPGATTGENFNSILRDMIAIPTWSIGDFMNERMRFLKQSSINTLSPYGEPGTFFYKVFFNFNTSYGLFGGLINNTNGQATKSINTARQFLLNNMESDRFSSLYKETLKNKEQYLIRFGQLLNYISNECPWFFKDVEGLADATKYDFVELAPLKKRRVRLVFNQDALDMRISTLIDLYKHACYDYVNFKEVIPENLRKFDMCIMLFNPPIAGMNFETIIKSNDPYTNTKKINITKNTGFTFNKDNPHLCSFKCIYLKNCEFDLDEFSSFSDSFNNEVGVIQELSMNVTFERFYTYSINKELDIAIADYGLLPQPKPKEK